MQGFRPQKIQLLETAQKRGKICVPEKYAKRIEEVAKSDIQIEISSSSSGTQLLNKEIICPFNLASLADDPGSGLYLYPKRDFEVVFSMRSDRK
jgi:hypothetical protein